MKNENKIIRLVWALMCASSSIDRTTNAVSIFNALEEVTVGINGPAPADVFKKGAVIPIPLEFIGLFVRVDDYTKDATCEATMDVIDPFGISMGAQNFPLKLEKNKKRTRVSVKFGGIKVTSSGEYNFKLSIKNKEGKFDEVASAPLEIKLTNQPVLK
jgi:hypothetical protein